MASPAEAPELREETPSVNGRKYKTKVIRFCGRNTPIILQNDNGPCPLLAVCNILLLRNKLGLSAAVTEVSQGRLMTLVAERLIASNSNKKDTGCVENQLQRISDALALLPRFATGIDVNVKFKNIDDFEFMRERIVFDILDIPLYHGWLVDPLYSDTSDAIGSKSYNTVMEELVALESRNMDALKLTKSVNPFLSDDDDGGPEIKFNDDWVAFETGPGEDVCSSLEADNASHDRQMDIGESQKHESCTSAPAVVQESSKDMTDGITAREGELIRSFLTENASQLTPYGLFRLQCDLKDGILCVFFRNNHFNTMFKYQGMLYILVTDQGYIKTPGVVWEKMTEVKGNTVFANSAFMSFKKTTNEIEEIGSDDDDETANLASVFKYLAKPDKTAAEAITSLKSDLKYAKALQRHEFEQQLEFEKQQSQPDRLADFPSGLVVGPTQEYSPWPKYQPSSSSASKRFKEARRLKEKCTLM